MQPGAQTVTLSFFPNTRIGEKQQNFSAGGQIKWSIEPFLKDKNGDRLAHVAINHGNRGQTFEYSLTLDGRFAG